MTVSTSSAAALSHSAAPMPSSTDWQTVASHDRVFAWSSHLALWFSLGVGLLVLQMGALLAPALGLAQAWLVVLLGSLLGAALLATVGALGARSGQASAGLMQQTLGRRFAGLPVWLNVIQLLGWGAFELVVMRDATLALAREVGLLKGDASGARVAATLCWGLLLTAVMALPMVQVVRRVIARIALPLVVLALAWISWRLWLQADALGWTRLWQQRGDGSLTFWAAIDLVVAMPISWLPLVADYARHGRSVRGAWWGIWLGFALANAWCYGLGVLIAVVHPGVEMTAAILAVQGGLLALAMVLLDEIDNAYGDVYSAALGLQSRRGGRLRIYAMGVALLCTVLALVLQMYRLEPFLILLSSVFAPLFGVIVGMALRLQPVPAAANGGPGVHWPAVLIWILGVALYHGLARGWPQLGSALPAFACTLVLAALWARHQRLSHTA